MEISVKIMATCDSLHKRFLSIPTSGLTVLEFIDSSFEEKPLELIYKFADIYNKKLEDNLVNTRLLESFRTFLCYEYKLKFEGLLEKTTSYSNAKLSQNVLKSLDNHQCSDEAAQLINHDVVILQLVLYFSSEQINCLFKEIIERKNLHNHYQTVEQLINAMNLRANFFAPKNGKDEELKKEIGSLLLLEIESWFKIIDENNSQEWRSFISFLVKILSTFNCPETFSSLWKLIANYEYDLTDKKVLSLLCAIIEDFFKKSSESIVRINSNFCSDERISRLISHHLVSKIQFYRKQAQFVLKKMMDYLKYSGDILAEELNTKFIPPFIICEEMQNKFFLLLEILEEKQTHLILPALNHLDSLIKFNFSENNGNSLNKNWLRCIFIRMLHHDNSIIMKKGLDVLLEMDINIFDTAFIELLVESLDNTFLYDNQSSEPRPQVVSKLERLFIKAEMSKSDFLPKFIVTASQIGWSPIPLFYMFEALGNNKEMNQIKYSTWAEQELEALRRITEANMRLQTKIMQIATQINIVKCITIYVKPPVDLFMLGRIFSSFPNEDFSQRGTNTWTLLTDYLIKNIDEATAIKFVSENCEKLGRNGSKTSNFKVLAVLIVLLYDAKKIFLKKSCISSISMCNLFNSLVGVDKRPYADLSVCFNALKMITCLLKLSPKSTDVYFQLILPFIESVLNLILKSLRKLPKFPEEAEIYVDVFSAIVNIRDMLPDKSRIFTNFNCGIHEINLGRILEANNEDNPLINKWYALNIIYLCNEATGLNLYEISSDFVVNNSDGKIVSECYGFIGKILHQFIKYSKEISEKSSKELLIKLENLAETKADHAIPSIAGSLEEIIEKSRNTNVSMNNWSQNMKNIIDICWKNVWDMKRGTEFRIAVRELTRLIINKRFLEVRDFRQIALDYVEEILTRSENTPSLRHILFSQMSTLEGKDLIIFEESIMSSLLHVNLGRTDKRVELQMSCYITKIYNVNYMDESLVWGLGTYTDFIIRTQLVLLILKMISWNAEETGNAYIPFLMAFLKKQKNKRYFGNSSHHKMKHRAMQLVLLLQPHLNEENTKSVHDTISDLILTESNQPSVRVMQEWILVRIYLHNKNMRDSIWDLFASGRENRPGSITSLVSIIYHISRLLPPDEKLDYIKKALTQILPSCFSQQFIVRLYSQVVLSKLLEIIHEITDDVDQYATIQEAVKESLRHGNLMTNSIKLFDNFYFAIFNPIQDYDLQTIYCDLPRLSNVSMSEWISPELFQQLHPDTEELPINVRNRGELSCAEIWEMSKEEYETQEPDFVEENDALFDIQKKIIPGTSGDSAPAPITLRQRLIAEDTGLIVVASLIDSFPNLGGLARTAEIFCARELVLKSKRHAENKEFQSLSVTAEKWITISEVKPHELRTYLLEKKAMGWNLVGAEQTANSINLLDMKFEGKTVLVLGNEKNGIPANLIQLMDMCVEIPQAGVVRSLNVHVTGAICMWHYATQHIFNC